MNSKIPKTTTLALALLIAVVIVGCGGTPVRGGSAYFDMHYRNPWYGFSGTFTPPQYIGPPPREIPSPAPGPLPR